MVRWKIGGGKLGRAWSILLQEINVPVHLWDGEDDMNPSVATGLPRSLRHLGMPAASCGR